MARIGGIYEIRNLTNGKRYIGKSNWIARRWVDHKYKLRKGCNPCGRLQDAWNKYGEASFVFAILEVVKDERHLLAREQHWFDALKPEYIIAETAGSLQGWIMPPEVRAKISRAHKGRVVSAETRRLQSEARKGRWKDNSAIAVAARLSHPVTDETREKMRMARLGTTLTEEHRQHISEGQLGRVFSDETRAKIGATSHGRTQSAETIAKRVAKNRGQKRTLETRALMAEKTRAAWARRREATALVAEQSQEG